MVNIDKFNAIQDEINLIVNEVREGELQNRQQRRLAEMNALLIHIKLNVSSDDKTIDREELHYWLHGLQIIISLEICDIELSR